jgi:hypothetical protein
MPNITITLDKKLYFQARVYAASHGTTVTQLLRGFLTDILEYGRGDDQEELEYILSRHPGLFRIADRNLRSQYTGAVSDEPESESGEAEKTLTVHSGCE